MFWNNEEISELEISNENITMKIPIIIISIRLYRVFDPTQSFNKHINFHKPCEVDNMLHNKLHFTDEETCGLEVQSCATTNEWWSLNQNSGPCTLPT